MYHCKDCGEYFAEPNVLEDREVGYAVGICPWCDSDDIEETYKCKCCGDEKADYSGGFCPHCMEELTEELNELSNRFKVTAAVLEDMICEHYGY